MGKALQIDARQRCQLRIGVERHIGNGGIAETGHPGRRPDRCQLPLQNAQRFARFVGKGLHQRLIRAAVLQQAQMQAQLGQWLHMPFLLERQPGQHPGLVLGVARPPGCTLGQVVQNGNGFRQMAAIGQLQQWNLSQRRDVLPLRRSEVALVDGKRLAGQFDAKQARQQADFPGIARALRVIQQHGAQPCCARQSALRASRNARRA
ncbi:hypothetical protein D3C71_1340250 [compost metagenome]